MEIFNAVEFVNGLDKAGKLSAEDKKFLADKLGIPEVAAVVQEAVLLRSDYSRKMNDQQTAYTAKAAEIEKKQKELDTLGASLVTWKEGEAKKAAKLSAEIDALRVELGKAAGKMKELGETYLIPEEDLYIPSIQATAASTAAASHSGNGNGNPPPGLTKEEVTQLVQDTMLKGLSGLVALPAEFMRIAEEHRALFGDSQKLDLKEVAEISRKSQFTGEPKSVDQVWQEKFGVPAKRAEVAEAAVNARISKGIEEGVAAKLSEMNLPSSRPMLPGSPVLRKEVTTIKPETGSNAALTAAMSAWNKGAYAAKP